MVYKSDLELYATVGQNPNGQQHICHNIYHVFQISG